MLHWSLALGIVAAGLASAPSRAAVVDQQPNGFSLQEHETIAAAPDKVWAELIQPAHWWNKAHTFSGDSKNLTLEAKAGGCWCETLADGGSVLHMTVVYAAPGKLLRLRGALGPFQSTGMDGAMNVVLEPGDKEKKTTKLTVVYNLGGYVWGGYQALPASADGVLNLQFYRLKQLIETGSPDTPRPAGEKP
ncbi:MAG: ATPase [Alphaproteobacteria bacterium]|nr:ATPase [Alphaproteobacteria bacterium]